MRLLEQKGTVTFSLSDVAKMDKRLAAIDQNQERMRRISILMALLLQDIRGERAVLDAIERFNSFAGNEARIDLSDPSKVKIHFTDETQGD